MRTLLAITIVTLLLACQDAGTELPPAATIAGVFPDSAAVGDTILIAGSSFGVPSTGVLRIGGMVSTAIVSWSATQIVAGVPVGAVSGTVQLAVTGQAGNAVPFKLMAAPEARVSFSGQVQPLINSNRCPSCHGGTNNLTVTSYATLTAGTSVNGPVVRPYDGEGSLIVRKVRGTAAGARMPQGGPYLNESQIELMARWIKQGARNN